MNERTVSSEKNTTVRPARREVPVWVKYVIIGALALFVVFMFLNNRASNMPFADVEQAVESQIDPETMTRADDQTIKRDYGLNAADYDGIMLYVSTFNLNAQEILLVKVEDESQMQDVEDAVDARIESRKNDFDGYIPEQAKLMDDALVTIRGDYLFLVISDEAEKYQAAFERSL
ncbi:MAG: DUF4358 domain-containing protein [Lachnospiraceae bacterium]|nr:DUF4358 domain-containing protein [Lachnospiraceae bacterium]